jgi:hypothetical protein
MLLKYRPYLEWVEGLQCEAWELWPSLSTSPASLEHVEELS